MPPFMDQNSGLIDKANTLGGTLGTTFMTALQATADETWREVAMEVAPQPGPLTVERFIEDVAGMKEWGTNRINDVQKTRALQFGFKNYERTIEVDRNDLEDDVIGQYDNLAQGHGMAAARMPAELVFGLLETGATALAYDGIAFFGAHAFGTNFTTNALSSASYEAALQAIAAFTTLNGQKYGLRGSIRLVVPQGLRFTAEAIVGNPTIADGIRNQMQGTAAVVVPPTLTDPNNWFVVIQDGPFKPILFSTKRAPSGMETDTSALFDKRKVYYGIDARWGRAFGLPQFAYAGIVA